jgi:hypothetical protein
MITRKSQHKYKSLDQIINDIQTGLSCDDDRDPDNFPQVAHDRASSCEKDDVPCVHRGITVMLD